jgi:ribosomal-protein-alanine N-acetyltransferase
MTIRFQDDSPWTIIFRAPKETGLQTNHSPGMTIDMIFIRPMQIEDLVAVQSIDRLSFSMPWPTSAYKYELEENPLSMLWVAEDAPMEGEAQIVGLIVVWFIVDEAHIATLAVHPDHRNKGYAKALLVTALRAAIHKGYLKATLEVRANNTAAQNLYRHFRFEIVGQRPRYYRDNNEDAIIMTTANLDSNYLEWLEKESWSQPENSHKQAQ